MKRLPLLATAVVGLLGCTSESPCRVPTPSEIAQAPPGEIELGIFKTFTGRLLSPIGDQVEVGTMPVNLAVSPDGRFAAVTHAGARDLTLANPVDQSIRIIEIDSGRIITTLAEPNLFSGIVFNPNGLELYAATGAGGEVVAYNGNFERSWVIPIENYPAGLAATPDGRTLLVSRMLKHTVTLIDTERIEKIADLETWAYPLDIAVSPDGSRAYVSNWGDSSIAILDLREKRTLGRVEVGKHPEGVALNPDGNLLYVANSDSDDVSVVDTATQTVAATISLKWNGTDPLGITPVDVAVSADGTRVYAATAGDNAIAVIDAAQRTLLGRIPVGHYPTALAASAGRLVVANMKSAVARPNVGREFVGAIQRGSVSILDRPSDSELPALTEIVRRNASRAEAAFPIGDSCTNLDGPVPLSEGQPSPLRHVVYVVHENKTYDSVLGDMPEPARTDPSLVRYGETVTPNLHALASRFANLDNCYVPGEQALQAHTWISQGWMNDFAEKNAPAMWGRPDGGAFFVPGADPAARPSDRLLLDALADAGLRFRMYGEVTGTLSDFFGSYRTSIDLNYPTWSLQVRDVDKAAEFIRELNEGIFPAFVILWLPNDVTNRTEPGKPSPESMVSDNDLATGQVVEAISRSPFWNETVVFIFNDDTQGQADHIDSHRGPCVVVGPHVKRGHTSHVHYSIPSFHRTMGLILGVAPISRYDQLAPPMYDLFSSKPLNSEPYTPVDPSIPFRRN
ncbi:MAG: bifunctional YncE family protein/alkaline phosphatase family protein [Nitrospirae bacterium]|nr:bifunctional YncE family protein/alkaline phosphatase family protein [Nitrospirota bacterium]